MPRTLLLLLSTFVAATLSAQPVRLEVEDQRGPAARGSALLAEHGWIPDVMSLVGLSEPGPPIRVLLVPEASPLAGKIPAWVAGFAEGTGMVVLLPERTPGYPDSGLEEVLAHEVAHVLARHAAERASSLQALNIGGLAVGTAVGVAGGSGGFSQIFAQIYGIGVNYGVALPHSRAQEFEADYVGLILMAKAGYSPGAAVSFWEGLRRDFAGQGTPGFLSSHPPSQARIEALLKALPKANSYLPYNQKPAEPLPAPAGPAQAPPGGP